MCHFLQRDPRDDSIGPMGIFLVTRKPSTRFDYDPYRKLHYCGARKHRDWNSFSRMGGILCMGKWFYIYTHFPFFIHLWNPYHWHGVLMNRWRKGEYTILNVWSNLKMGSYSTQSLDKYKYKYKSKCSKSRPATASTLIEANSMDSWTKSEWQYLKDEGRWQYLFQLPTCFPLYTKTVLPFCNCQIRRLLIQLHRTPEKESLTSDWLEDRSLLKPVFWGYETNLKP